LSRIPSTSALHDFGRCSSRRFLVLSTWQSFAAIADVDAAADDVFWPTCLRRQLLSGVFLVWLASQLLAGKKSMPQFTP